LRKLGISVALRNDQVELVLNAFQAGLDALHLTAEQRDEARLAAEPAIRSGGRDPRPSVVGTNRGETRTCAPKAPEAASGRDAP